LFDGWVFAAAQASGTLGQSLSMGIWAHKLPESVAFGVILKAAVVSRRRALLWAVIAQTAVLAGAALEVVSAPYLGVRWIAVLLAMGGGTFLFLGYHTVEGAWRIPRFLRAGSDAP
jgi:zinc transporter ZupT